MASETDFLNGALGAAGCGRITNIEDHSVEAGWCRTYYSPLRRSTQRMSNWKFCGARLQLPLDYSAPAFGYGYSYALPASLLKIRAYNNVSLNLVLQDDPTVWQYQASSWRIEGRHLYSNDSSAFIEYIQDITNPDVWDALYYQMLMYWLASQLAIAIRKDVKAGNELLQSAMGVWMPMALAVDGQEQSVQVYRSDDLIWGRNPG